MKSFISQVALVSAATVTNPCPNEYWEPVLDDNGVQVVNEGSIVCAPIPEAYKITCSPTGIELDIKYELMYDQVLDEQREEIGESLKIEPAKLGNCLNQADQEETSLDYRFQLRYDEKNENGDYCYVSFLNLIWHETIYWSFSDQPNKNNSRRMFKAASQMKVSMKHLSISFTESVQTMLL